MKVNVADQMNADHLRTYMKDHYAGSVAALQLLDHLVSTNSGKPRETLFIALRHEVGEDQNALQKMLHDLDATEGLMRNTVAFIGEKLSRIKLLLEDPSETQLAHLEKLKTAPVWGALSGTASYAYKDGVPVQAPGGGGVYFAATRHHIDGHAEEGEHEGQGRVHRVAGEDHAEGADQDGDGGDDEHHPVGIVGGDGQDRRGRDHQWPPPPWAAAPAST